MTATSNHAVIASPNPAAAWPLKPLAGLGLDGGAEVAQRRLQRLDRLGDGLRGCLHLGVDKSDGHGRPLSSVWWVTPLSYPCPPTFTPSAGGARSYGLRRAATGNRGAMPSYDYEVDLESMGKAAQGLNDTLKLFKDKDVEDLVPSKGDVGHDVVWDALDEFKGRWEEGVNNLCQDVEEMAGRLGKIAMNYYETDKAGYDALSALKGTIAAVKVM